MPGISEFGTYDAVGLAALVRQKAVSPSELCDEAIRRIEATNPAINAVVTPLFESARATAAGPLPDGPFRGVPFLLKDLGAACVEGPLSEGSRFFAEQRPTCDSTLVKRHREAGLVFVGKTNTPELGILPVTEPELFGPTRNPWHPGFTPGGSSGGSAAAVAAGMVPAAHGGDGAGSIRIPASCCGLFGLKPSRGRSPTGPDRSEFVGGFGVEHVLTRSVRDSAAFLDVIAAPDPDAYFPSAPVGSPFAAEVGKDPGRLRIALSVRPPFPGNVHADCLAAVRQTARLCTELGHTVEEAELELDSYALAVDFFRMACVEIAAAVGAAEEELGRRARRRDFERDTWLCVLIGRRTPAVKALLAKWRLHAVLRKVVAFSSRFDLVLTPTLAVPPVPLGALETRGFEGWLSEVVASLGLGFVLESQALVMRSVLRFLAFTPFSPLANLTGQPAMNVPLYWNQEGLPIGSMFTAPFGQEGQLLRLAAQLEAARPWAHLRPPIHADAPPGDSAAPATPRVAAGAG